MNTILSCPADCTTALQLPAIGAEQDCTNYNQSLSQISDLYIRPDGAPDIFATWATVPTYVAASVDNTVTDNSKTKWITGIGSVPPAEKEVTIYPKRKSKVTNRTYTLTLRVLNMTDTQREFCRRLQCGWTGFTFYYGDVSDYVYGVTGGLKPKSVDCDLPLEGEDTSKAYATITIVWEANGDPDRKVNPHAS